jgi:hypothetical protein
MLPGVVAIDFPDRTPHSWVDAATSACEAALGDGRCVEGGAGVTSAWRATVVLSDEPSAPVLRIELYEFENDAPESARQLRFHDIDPDRQRWASAGVVIAAMVSASEAGRSPSEEPLEPTPFTPDDYRAPTRDERSSTAPRPTGVWVDGTGVLERGFASELPALGAGVAVGARPFSLPLLVSAGASVTWASAPLASRRVTFGVGPGVRFVDGVITWDGVAQLRLQHYSVVATRTLNGIEQTDTGGYWRAGPALVSAVGVRLIDSLALVFASDVGWYLPQIDVSRENQLIGRVPPFNFGIDVGIRWISPS